MRIVITLGDPNGIGAEVTLKALEHVVTSCSIILVGNAACLQNTPYHKIEHPNEAEVGTLNFFEIKHSSFVHQWGEKSEKAGKIAIESVRVATQWAIDGLVAALVTAPLSKETVHAAGFLDFIGHTEFIAAMCNTEKVLMTMVCDDLRVALASTHIPLKAVATTLNPAVLTQTITLFHKSLQKDFGFKNPRIAVLGLNPHAGDGGVLGKEEIEWIHPTIEKLQENGIQATGTYAADGFFGLKMYQDFEGVVALYHDQGLIPFKTIAFERGVNFTAGLPIIRTSPDHGTAFNIAGKGIADERSMVEAVSLAIHLASQHKIS